MKNFKRVLAIVLTIAMMLPMCIVSVNADGAYTGKETSSEELMTNDWLFFGGRFLRSSGIYSYARKAQGHSVTANDDGSLTIHSPGKTESGDKLGSTSHLVSYVTNQNPSFLNYLTVTVQPGENFSFKENGTSLGMLWTLGQPLTMEELLSAGSQAGLDTLNYGLHSGDMTSDGLHGFVLQSVRDDRNEATEKGEIGLYVKVAGTDPTYENDLIATNVYIYKFDGEWEDKNDQQDGWRWSFVPRTYAPHTTNSDDTGIYSFQETIDTTHGLTFEIIPDETLGVKVCINGKEFYKGSEVGYFPNDTTGSINRGLDNLIDIIGMSENYTTSMTYARKDIDLTSLAGYGEDGYLTVGSTGGAGTEKEGYDYHILTVNGVPAADWTGGFNEFGADEGHEHEYEVIAEYPATCIMQSRTISQCYCGAIHQNQFYTSVEEDPRFTFYDGRVALDNTADKYDWDGATYQAKLKELILPAYWNSTDALGHDYVAEITEPTCHNDGLAVYTCSRCDKTYSEVLLATGHDVTNWVEADGVLTRTCNDCGETETKAIATSEAAEDYWTVAYKSSLSHLGIVGEGNAILDFNGSYANEDGVLAVYDYAATNGSTDAKIPVAKAVSNYSSKLDGFSATVENVGRDMDADGDLEYNYALSFIWTNKPDHYNGYMTDKNGFQQVQFSTYKNHYNTFTRARTGFLWDDYLGGEYSFAVNLLDCYWVDINRDGDAFDTGEFSYGVEGDGVYDAVTYASVKNGTLISLEWLPVTYAMNAPVTVDVTNTLEELSFSINGDKYDTGMVATQLFNDTYYFGVASKGLTSADYKAGLTDPTAFNGEVTLEQGHTLASVSFKLSVVNGKAAATWTGDGHMTADAHTCEFGDFVVTTAPTCSNEGVETRLCEVCGATETNTLARLSETGEHVWGEWAVTRESTCAAKGEEARTCEVCGDVETNGLPTTDDHTWGEWKEDPAPTCDKNGSSVSMCIYCAKRTTKKLDPLGHSWSDWARTVEPTETTEGTLSRVCATCALEETAVIPMVGQECTDHTWGEWVITVEPQIGIPGEKTRTCYACAAVETKETKYVCPDDTHTWGDWEVTLEPTVDTEGKKKRTCTVCGETESAKIPVITDTPVIPGECAHVWGEWEVVTPADCMFSGEEKRVCANCGEEETQEIAPVAHTIVE
ncbi:MAG: hypothetical protein IJC50_01935, partial [Clostridia bacterium]|nr:hypothetical protein [Clostridia bacterium]